jgi:hypothetical protein
VNTVTKLFFLEAPIFGGKVRNNPSREGRKAFKGDILGFVQVRDKHSN